MTAVCKIITSTALNSAPSPTSLSLLGKSLPAPCDLIGSFLKRSLTSHNVPTLPFLQTLVVLMRRNCVAQKQVREGKSVEAPSVFLFPAFLVSLNHSTGSSRGIHQRPTVFGSAKAARGLAANSGCAHYEGRGLRA